MVKDKMNTPTPAALTLEDMREERKACIMKITEALNDFQEKTGLRVLHIHYAQIVGLKQPGPGSELLHSIGFDAVLP
jgi:hypothetical protein